MQLAAQRRPRFPQQLVYQRPVEAIAWVTVSEMINTLRFLNSSTLLNVI